MIYSGLGSGPWRFAAAAILFFSASPGICLAQIRGMTMPIRAATVSSKVAGTIERIGVKEGDRVEKGDVLIELEANIEKLEVQRRKLIWESRAELDSASNRVTKLHDDLDRSKSLFKSTESVSKEELDGVELDYNLAVAEFRRLECAEEREKVEFLMAEEQMRERSITAPISGTISKLYLEQGENCEASQPLVRIVDVSACKFSANVEASAAAGVKVGDAATIRVADGADSVSDARITYVSPVVDPASGLLEIKAEFPNAAGIRPGSTAVLTTHE